MPTPSHNPIGRDAAVPSDVRTQLTVFATTALGIFASMQPGQLAAVGMQETTSALAYKMPIAVGSSAWKAQINGIKYRSVSELILSVAVKDFSDGVIERAKVIESSEWQGWGMQPATMASAARLVDEQAIAAALESGETDASVENNLEGDTTSTAIKVFGVNKPADPLNPGGPKKITNLLANTPLNLANIDKVWQALRTVPNGDSGYKDQKWRYVIVSADLELLARRYFEDQGADNATVTETSGTSTAEVAKPNTARKYGITVLVSPFLTQAGVWYAVATDSVMPDLAPWIVLTQIPANDTALLVANPASPVPVLDASGIEWIVNDKTSELYKHGVAGLGKAGMVALGAKRSVGAAIVAPWRIIKCKPGA